MSTVKDSWVVYTSILHYESLVILVLLLSIISCYFSIIMPLLSQYARYITKREVSQNWNYGSRNQEKGRKIKYLQMT